MIPKKAVLLAAGRGQRLRPATDHTPKPLLVHQGKPTLDFLMDSLVLAGINDVILVAHHLYEQIESYAVSRSRESKQTVRCIRQPELLGTADALQAVIEAYPELAEQPFVLSATDYIVPLNFFPDLINFHLRHGLEFTASLKQLRVDELQSRSSVRFEDDNSIAEIVEKPAAGQAPSSIGANLTFVLPESIAPYVKQVPLSSRGEREIQYAINQWLREGGRGFGLVQPIPPEWSAELSQ